MTAPSAPSPDRRAIITEALRKIDDLTARLAIAEKSSTEPIAVVGIGCRLPGGVGSAEDFWTLLSDGASGVVEVPADRWDADAYYSADHTVPGTICNRVGGFLTSWKPDEFDAGARCERCGQGFDIGLDDQQAVEPWMTPRAPLASPSATRPCRSISPPRPNRKRNTISRPSPTNPPSACSSCWPP